MYYVPNPTHFNQTSQNASQTGEHFEKFDENESDLALNWYIYGNTTHATNIFTM